MSMEKINSEELNGKQERIPLSDDEMEQVSGGKRVPFVCYTVRYGDTVSGLAVYYHTTVDEILRLNKLANASSIEVNQELLIPDNRL